MKTVSDRTQIRDHEIVGYSGWNFYQLRHTRYEEDRLIPEHRHNSLEISYVVSGYKEQTFEEKTVCAGTGTLLLTNSGVLHSLSVSKGLEGIVLLISKKALEEYCPKSSDYGFDLSRSPQKMPELADLMVRMTQMYENGNKLETMDTVLEILRLLNSSFISEKPLEVRHSEAGSAVHAVEEFINANYMEDLTLDQIAGALGYNRTYLSETYKKKKGIGIFDYLKEVRIKTAMQQLRETRKSITDIALSCGFSSSQVFSRTFSKNTGLSPGAYRRQH